MLKILKKALILMAVFILGVIGTALLLNSEITDDRVDMNSPTLPELMIEYGGQPANRMCGYRQKMQSDFIRDSVTPMDTKKEIVFLINPYEASVDSLSYEIRTSDGSRVVENKKLKTLTKSKTDNTLRVVAAVSSDLLLNQEYSMQIALDTSEGTLYYYTRVISRPGMNTEHYVQFVHNFYEKCMDKEMADDLASFLEPLDKGSPTNFGAINIHSSLSEVSWGHLYPQLTQRGIPVIKDINETTASISLDYQITTKNEEDITETYNVHEFYRLRYTETRTRLLDFERTTSQIFSPSLPVITDEGLMLGIRDRNVTFMTDEGGDIIAFVQEGDLWTYTPATGKVVKVFSFRNDQGEDVRDNRADHDIKIIRVDSNGDVDFVLYGYMNRGAHEGYTGICVYHYNSDKNALDENVFIPCTESYEFLKFDMGTLSYVSEDNHLYLMLAQKLYQIDVDQGKYNVLEDNIDSEHFVVSETNRHAAWGVMDGNKAGSIRMIDFETVATKTLTPVEGQQLRVFGFMNEDVVYGFLSDENILLDATGHEIEGITSLNIEDFDGQLKKDYYSEGMFITSVNIGPALMEFQLAAQVGGKYVSWKKDNIINNVKTSAKQVAIEMIQRSRTGIQVRLAFDESPKTDHVLLVISKTRTKEGKSITLDSQIPKDNVFYVYAKGGLDNIYTDLVTAIQRADEMQGVVLNRGQQYIWERGNKKTQQMLYLEDIPKTILEGNWDAAKLQKELGKKGTVLNLSGCTLDQVLYHISAERPVLVKLKNNQTVVIIGYDQYNTHLYHPDTGETEIYGMNDSKELFLKYGNLFLTYISNQAN